MKVPELKALAKEQGLKRYSKLRKAELIALLTPAGPSTPATRTRPPNQLDLHHHLHLSCHL